VIRQFLDDPGQIVRVDTLLPGFISRFDFIDCQAEHLAPTLIKSNITGGNIPVPSAQVGPGERQLSPLFNLMYKSPGFRFCLVVRSRYYQDGSGQACTQKNKGDLDYLELSFVSI